VHSSVALFILLLPALAIASEDIAGKLLDADSTQQKDTIEEKQDVEEKRDKDWSKESSYTVANTALKGTQDTDDRPNPLFSPTVGQINLNKGSWENWPWEVSGLSGDWFGARTALEDRGIFINNSYNIFFNDNFRGGIETGPYNGGVFNSAITIDTDALVDHPGGTFFVNFQHWNWYTRSYQLADGFDPTGNYTGSNGNIADTASVNQISQLYYSQDLFDGHLNLAFGKQDANNIFSNIPGAGGFMYNAASYSATLNPYFPTWPNESTALTAIINFNEDVVGSFGWFDGSNAGLYREQGPLGQTAYFPAPGTGGRGPATFFDNQGHWFLISELGVNWQLGEDSLPGVLFGGAWIQTGRTQTGGTLNDGPGVEDVPGAYASFSQTVWAPDQNMAKLGGGVICFGQFGWSDPNKNAVHWSLMAGISATGVIPGRPMDAMGILGSYTSFSDNPGTWQSTTPTGLAGPSGGAESAIEAFYRVQVTPWFSVQPGIEWLGTPSGGSPTQLEDAVMGYVMVEVVF
tara:strand:- start:2424 stop:3977 length:1554 start_codon:yes stop_codon:yes gene_type:complete